MLRTAILVALATAAATPAFAAGAGTVHRSHDIAAALKAGCAVQQVHTPTGKVGNAAAIVRCPSAAAEAEARRDQPRTQKGA